MAGMRALECTKWLGCAILALAAACQGEDGAPLAPLTQSDGGSGSGETDDDGGVDAGIKEDPNLTVLDPKLAYHFGYLFSGPGSVDALRPGTTEADWGLGHHERPSAAWHPIPSSARWVGLRGGDGSPVYIVQDPDNPQRVNIQVGIASGAPSAGDGPPNVTMSAVEAKCDAPNEAWLVPESNVVVYLCVVANPGESPGYYTDTGEPFPVPSGYELRHIGFNGSMLLIRGSSVFVMSPDGTVVPVAVEGSTGSGDLYRMSAIRALPDGFWLSDQAQRWKVSYEGVATLEGTYQPLRKRPMGSLSVIVGERCRLEATGDLLCFVSYVCCDGITGQAEGIARLSLEAEGRVIHEEPLSGTSPALGSDETLPIPRVQLKTESRLVTGP